jgi:tetratricopeptide (TPR) repeat protein
MLTKLIVRAALALLLSAIAVPASAQALKGRVLNQQKRPVSEANVVATCVSVPSLKPQGTVTDSNGQFSISGLQFGKWNVVVTKGTFYFKTKKDLNLMPGVVEDMGDVMLEPMPAGMTATAPGKDTDAQNKKSAEIQSKLTAANEDITAGRFDDALVKLDAIAKDIPKCSTCAAKIGDVYLKKNDLANAEKFFLQAIEYDANTVDAYNALATVYNSQQKYDDALKMTAKVKELSTATGGPADPVAMFNEGVVLWNAGKIAEAEEAFKKTTELDPKKAEAFYQLGIAQISSGKMPDAVKSLETYLKLAPTGKDADTAKALLAQIKK